MVVLLTQLEVEQVPEKNIWNENRIFMAVLLTQLEVEQVPEKIFEMKIRYSWLS